jgi:DNA-binding response OmpR family regulator
VKPEEQGVRDTGGVRPPLAALAAPSDSRRRVLLIEDDHDIAEAIGYQLEKAGLQMRVARTGEEGLEAVRRGVDLVLLDLNLPGMDGLEVCRLIRRQATTAHVPIIIVSARADEVDRVLGLEMGADDYVVKPFSLKELAARCRVALRRADGGGEAPQGYRDENFEVEFDASACATAARRSASRRRSSSCSATCSSARGACSRASGCWSGSGATRATWRRAASTRTSGACGSSWVRPVSTSRRSSGSATGS